jgi:sulfide dehydrogenase [flavocytochrome c] flavoprotein subunit
MPDGGTFVMSVPMAPYRCPPGPYERACMVATYFKKAKPKSKIIILDGNPDIASKKPLFEAAWKKHYGYKTDNSMIDYRPNNMPRCGRPEEDDGRHRVRRCEGRRHQRRAADAGREDLQRWRACDVGLDGKPGPWCAIDYRTFESLHVKNVHILGDSTLTNFPKSGSVANNTGKMCAAAIAELLNGREPDAAPVVTNTCYSASSPETAFHVATVFRYQAAKGADGKITPSAMIAQKGGGVSKEESELEFAYMESWAHNVWADTLGLPADYKFTAKG